MPATTPHPWLHLALQQPSLVTEHLSAWAAMLANDGPPVGRIWRRRLWLRLSAVVCLVLGLGLAGVAGMLWALAPASAIGTGVAVLALAGLPALPLLASLGCWRWAASLDDGGAWLRLQAQWQADRALWHTPPHGGGA